MIMFDKFVTLLKFNEIEHLWRFKKFRNFLLDSFKIFSITTRQN